MQRIAFACAAFMILASPLRAQQAPPDQSLPTLPEQSLPPAPPPSQSGSELPPPFIPPPPARVYADHHSRAHHRMTARHRARTHRHVTARHRATHGRHRSIYVSKRTSRQCHRMSYVQIVRHSSCRALMNRDLKAAEHRHSYASRHRRSAHHHRLVHHHRTRRHRG